MTRRPPAGNHAPDLFPPQDGFRAQGSGLCLSNPISSSTAARQAESAAGARGDSATEPGSSDGICTAAGRPGGLCRIPALAAGAESGSESQIRVTVMVRAAAEPDRDWPARGQPGDLPTAGDGDALSHTRLSVSGCGPGQPQRPPEHAVTVDNVPVTGPTRVSVTQWYCQWEWSPPPQP